MCVSYLRASTLASASASRRPFLMLSTSTAVCLQRDHTTCHTPAPVGLNTALRHSTGLNTALRHSPGLNAALRHSPGLNTALRHSPVLNTALRHSTGLNKVLRHSPGLNTALRHSPGRNTALWHSPGLNAALRPLRLSALHTVGESVLTAPGNASATPAAAAPGSHNSAWKTGNTRGNQLF